MKRWLKWVGIGVIVVVVAAQFARPERINPPADPAASFRADSTVPAAVREAVVRACYDCHSNETVWPWYSAVTPVNYFLVDDVKQGRKHVNFSDWSRMNPRRRVRILGDIADELTQEDMPPAPYRFMHPSAMMSPTETQLVVSWANAGRETRQDSSR